MPDPLAALLAAAALAVVHVFAGHLRFVHVVPRSGLLSAAGGVAVAYVFVHLLPEIAEGQAAIDATAEGVVAGIERHAYLLALAGLAFFYGVERLTLLSRARRRDRNGEDVSETLPFAVSVGSFAAYNGVIGYLLVERADQASRGDLALFALALGLHFLVNDFGLRDHHKDRYDRVGRWVLAAAVLAGWLVGRTAEVSEAAIAVVIAFVGGGVVLNVLKEELPEQRLSRFSPFALGAAGYAAVLLAV